MYLLGEGRRERERKEKKKKHYVFFKKKNLKKILDTWWLSYVALVSRTLIYEFQMKLDI